MPALLSCLLVLGFFFASSGLFVIDEFVYVIAADAIARGKTLIVDNGYPLLNLESLRAAFLIPGPNGLTSPYPSGITVLNGAGFAIADVRGIIALNTLSGITTLFLVYSLAWRMSSDSCVASVSVLIMALCSFWPEYIFSVESHAIGVLAVTTAVYCALRALEPSDALWRSSLYWSFFTGTAIGFGVLIRADTILILPAVVMLGILRARNPVPVLIAGAFGLIPFFLMGATVNEFKFGTLNPLSYGSSGGGTSVGGHRTMAAGLGLIFVTALCCRILGSRSPVFAFALVVAFAALFRPVFGKPCFR